ncbi:MAG TPA: tRNA (N6-isopentenyl adenosine(37)-C2)-methylthiotransferase MiaB [Treponema sp.]|nr:tRNA (N6-isopentenyl adenosine(37)-C2)-methylthiotransferase MiaB [Treponema sp.]
MTFSIETYGCQMNYAESASVVELLRSRGWTQNEDAKAADLVIINTCSVRITAETRVFGRIAHYTGLKKKRKFVLIVMGCMAQRLHDEFPTRFPGVDYAVGMFERDIFSDLFVAIEAGATYVPTEEKPVNEYYFSPTSHQAGAFQSFIPIMNGCNNFCSYCIVPYVRGREVSRNLDEIIKEIAFLEDRGVREITLLGQNVNSYCYTDSDTGKVYDFPALLELVARTIEKRGIIRWIRFMSSHPKDFSDSLIDIIAREPAVCSLVHLPVQHGSTRILEAMNRKYTREDYLSLVGRIRERIPGVNISTDILMGFPGETEEDVEETLSLIRTVGYDAAFMYHYNPREGTAAYTLENRIPEPVKKERLARVIKLQHGIAQERMKSRVGSEVVVLIESVSRNNPDELFGHTELGDMVVFSGKHDHRLLGQFVQAHITGLRGRTFRAKIVIIEPD